MTARVRGEWRARIAAEYTSATLTQSYVLWLMQAGAPPDLIDAGLVIVADELVHSRMSHDVYVAAGGSEAPRLDRNALGLTRSNDELERDLIFACVRVFCLGETVAVPLFKHLRQGCTQPSARAALDRILRDEARHRDFGWDVLDWLMTTTPDAPALVERALPKLFAELESSYGNANAIVASDDGVITDEERSWGLAPPREYAEILDRTFEREWIPRFRVREITALRPARAIEQQPTPPR